MNKSLILLFSLTTWPVGYQASALPPNAATALQPEIAVLESQTDTVLYFTKDGRSFPLRVAKSRLDGFRGFKEFIIDTDTSHLPYRMMKVLELTGDGVLDTCESSISWLSDQPLVVHRITSQGREIWRDTLVISDEGIASMYWEENEESYRNLKPYSALFIARKYFFDFVGNVVDTLGPSFEFFIRRNEQSSQYWRQLLKKSTLISIWSLNLVNPAEMIWDPRIHKFIVYAAP